MSGQPVTDTEVTARARRQLLGEAIVSVCIVVLLSSLLGGGVGGLVALAGAGAVVALWPVLRRWFPDDVRDAATAERARDRERRVRIRLALRRHADPGVPWRGMVDAAARRQLRWAPWSGVGLLVGVLGFAAVIKPVGLADWVRFAAFTAVVVGMQVGTLRDVLAARRWLADPPHGEASTASTA